jgi:hypothetical protein
MANSFDKIINDVRHSILRREAAKCEPVKHAFVREPSKGEQEREYVPNYITRSCLFCIHQKSYFGECKTCRRDKKEAQMRFDLFCKERGIPK